MAKGSSNAHHQQQQQSSMIKLDKSKAEQINLSVIQRLDADVEQVIATAGHVALYDFNVASSQWSRKDVEGSLFLVKRRGAPRFRFVILNKKGDDNFWEDVGQNFSCEMQEPYVMYRNGPGGGVIGIWFYEQEDCQKFASLFDKITTTFAAPSDASIDVGMTTNNALAQVFAGIKMSGSAQPPVAPPAPPQALPLLTPQHFISQHQQHHHQQQQQQQQHQEQQHHQQHNAQPVHITPSPLRNGQQNQGAALLHSLHAHVDKSSKGSAKIHDLLQSLSNNKAFCDILYDEMSRAGFFGN